MVIIRKTDNCTGCKACELACSYHHRHIFSPSISSISIKNDDPEGKVELILYKHAADGHLACNCPEGEEACLEFCDPISRNELENILRAGETKQ